MDINYFKEFVTLAGTGNFSEAARKLSLNQPTLTKHIKKMEKELGEPLIIRNTKKFKITEYGQILLRDARKIADVQQHYTELLEDRKRSQTGILKIGSISMMPHYNLTSLFSNYTAEYPSIHMGIYNGPEHMLDEALVCGRCELAFMRFSALPESDLVQIPLISDYFCIVLSRKHPLAGSETLSFDQLGDEQFILLGGCRERSGSQERLFEHAGFEPINTTLLENYENILDLVRYNLGITVMTDYTAHYLADDSLKIIPLSPHYPIKLSLYYLKKTKLSDAASNFVFYVQSHKNTLQSKPVPLCKAKEATPKGYSFDQL